MLEELDKDIQKFEEIIEEHERLHEEHPLFLWHRVENCSHKEYAEDCKKIVGYLKELRRLMTGEDR